MQLQRRDFKTFVVYLVEAHLRVGSEQVGVCLFRRYREFWALDRILSRRYSLLSPIPFPEKHAFGNTSKKTISERTEQLQLYLDTILKNPAVASDDLVLNFFCAVSDRRLAGTSIFTAALVGRAPQACLGLSLRACALNTPTHQPAQRGLADLPMPLLVRVMSCLGPRDITEAARVCRKFYTAASHYFVWRKLAADMGCDLRITTNKIFGTGRNGGILGDRDPKHALLRTLKVDAAVRHSYQLNSYHVRCLCSSKKLFGMMFGPAADALKRRLAPAAKDPFGDVFTGQSQPSSSSPSSLSRDKIGGGGDRNDGGGSGTSGGGQFDGYDDTGEDGEEGQASVEDALNPQPSAVIAFGIAQSASLMSDAKDFYTESDTTNGSSIDSGTVGYDLSNSSGGGVGDSGGDDSDNSKDVLTGTTTNRNFSAEYKKSRNARKDKKRNGGSNYAADGGDDYYDGSCDCDGVCEDSAKDDVRHSHLPPHTSTVPSLGSGKDGVSGASHRVRAQFFNVHTPGQPGAEEVKGFCFTLCVQSECRMTPFTQHFLLRSNFVILAFYQTDTSERLAQLERLAAKVHALCPTMPVFLVSVPPPVSAAIPGILKDIAARGRSRAAAAAAAIGRLESLAVATGAVKAYDLGLVKRSGGEASYVIQDIAAHLAPHLRDPAPEFTTVETCLTPQAINNDLPAVIHKIDALYVNMGEALAADSSGERRPLRSTVAATGAWIRSLEEAWGHDNAAPSSAGTAVTQRQGVFDPDFGKIAAVLLFGARNFFLQQLRRISIDKTIEYLITSDDSVAERFATVKEYLANIVRYTHASALWKGSPAADRHRVQCEIETYFFERVYKIIFPIVSEDKNADRAIWRKIHALRTIHPAQLRIKREFWNYDAWQAAIDGINSICRMIFMFLYLFVCVCVCMCVCLFACLYAQQQSSL